MSDDQPMPTLALLLRKLEGATRLPEADRQAILALPHGRRSVASGSYLIREGDRTQNCAVLLSGFVARHKIVRNGGRQIVAIHIPGEALDLQGLYLDRADHNAQTLTRAEIALIPMTAVRQIVEERPAVARAVMLDMLIEASILREWLTNVGRRDARTRIAHLLCEFAMRTDAQGIRGVTYALPLTQEQIGDALGLTSVHVNRSLKALEEDGLITRVRRMVTFTSVERLRDVGEFGDLYLHRNSRAVPL